MDELSLVEARALSIGAQGFGRTITRPPPGKLEKTVRTMGVLQLDSVNVLARAHYLPLFARLGPYDRAALDKLAYQSRKMFEYWGHEASLLPIDSFPLFRWKMNSPAHPRWEAFAVEHRDAISQVLKEIRERGPLGLSDFTTRGERGGPWWGWPAVKGFLEYLFLRGRLTTSSRRNFERIYDLPERVIPKKIWDLAPLEENLAKRQLILKAAQALGVGTANDLADYFRFSKAGAKKFAQELTEEGLLREVKVEGWPLPAYVPRVSPKPAVATALVGPFDPVVWDRARAERLFGMHYRIEIYVPQPKRVYGYYVLPFLLENELVARLDLKADRKAGRLWVRGAFPEAGVSAKRVVPALADELQLMAAWLELDRVEVEPRGSLGAPLSAYLRKGG